jgi:hypothetical protein
LAAATDKPRPTSVWIKSARPKLQHSSAIATALARSIAIDGEAVWIGGRLERKSAF